MRRQSRKHTAAAPYSTRPTAHAVGGIDDMHGRHTWPARCRLRPTQSWPGPKGSRLEAVLAANTCPHRSKTAMNAGGSRTGEQPCPHLEAILAQMLGKHLLAAHAADSERGRRPEHAAWGMCGRACNRESSRPARSIAHAVRIAHATQAPRLRGMPAPPDHPPSSPLPPATSCHLPEAAVRLAEDDDRVLLQAALHKLLQKKPGV